jgi:hypothetical protein
LRARHGIVRFVHGLLRDTKRSRTIRRIATSALDSPFDRIFFSGKAGDRFSGEIF